MESTSWIDDIGSLPPDAQKQVKEFVAFPKTRYPVARETRRAKRTNLADEPCIDMWRDREDMRDSSAWVRRTRESGWERSE